MIWIVNAVQALRRALGSEKTKRESERLPLTTQTRWINKVDAGLFSLTYITTSSGTQNNKETTRTFREGWIHPTGHRAVPAVRFQTAKGAWAMLLGAVGIQVTTRQSTLLKQVKLTTQDTHWDILWVILGLVLLRVHVYLFIKHRLWCLPCPINLSINCHQSVNISHDNLQKYY